MLTLLVSSTSMRTPWKPIIPPSLLITSTRDFLLSLVIYTHTQLMHAGVEAELHVWEGLGHAFFFDPEIPESRQAYDAIVKFFDKHLSNR